MHSTTRRTATLIAIALAAAPPLAPAARAASRAHVPQPASVRPAPAPGADRCEPGARDGDGDGLADACERELAQRWAPVIYHSSDESNFPTNVDAHLRTTELHYYDDAHDPDLDVLTAAAPTQRDLLARTEDGVTSDGTRSRQKHRTFFLADVPEPLRAGSDDTRDWTTYVHVYPNDEGGVTLQYWRFYAFNDAMNDHGGDWEGFHVVLDAAGELSKVRLLGHTGIEEVAASAITREGTHVRVFSEGGGHATHASGHGIVARGCTHDGRCTIDVDDPRTFVRQETWPGGAVSFPDGRIGEAGAIVNVGARMHPLEGQDFIRYSGLWGSPGTLYGFSGYWGPAFNETGMTASGFVTAWCAGMRAADESELRAECYPDRASP